MKMRSHPDGLALMLTRNTEHVDSFLARPRRMNHIRAYQRLVMFPIRLISPHLTIACLWLTDRICTQQDTTSTGLSESILV